MHLSDEALILQVAPFRETDALVTVFAREQGLLRGMVRRALSPRQRGTYSIGNRVEVQWSARLEEHLGHLSCELMTPGGSMIMGHRARCYALQSMCALVQMSFEQRDPHPSLYEVMEKLLESMRFDLPWQADYARFEAVLLREAGFGLGLERCIATGQGSHLRYVSPRSGCAVSVEAGEPYHDKLFAYPHILVQEMHVQADAYAVEQALVVTGYFLQQWLLAALDKPEPACRKRLISSPEMLASAEIV